LVLLRKVTLPNRKEVSSEMKILDKRRPSTRYYC